MDKEFQKKLLCLNWLKPQDFGLKGLDNCSEIFNSPKDSNNTFYILMNAIVILSIEHLPGVSSKLSAISDCSVFLTTLLNLTEKKFSQASTEDVLPAYAFTILKAQPSFLFIHLK